MYQIPSLFQTFISQECDRCGFIQKYLIDNGIESTIIRIDDKKHIYVMFPKIQYNPSFKIKTVIAHYDRVEGSPGANDNSAAVFCLLEWAVKLSKMKSFHNIRLIFTDGEEQGEDGITSQGAFALASHFTQAGILNDDIFVFDCMGRGTVPILSDSALPKSASALLTKKYAVLESKIEKLVKKASGGKWFKLPVNYSDNASFIANNLAAVALTMLPSSEVTDALNGQTPMTWRLLHTPQDNLSSLNPEAFELMHRILDSLASLKSLY